MGLRREPACHSKPYSNGSKAFNKLWKETKDILYNKK